MTRPLKPMPSIRSRIHEVFCATQYECKYSGAEDPGVWCRSLDAMLDFNDEMLLHNKARHLAREHDKLTDKGRRTLGAGLTYAVELTDPYEKIDPFDPETDEINEAAEKRPDCPACVAGREHYHRKSDGSRVVRPDIDSEKET